MCIQHTVTYERKPLQPFVSKHEIVAIGAYVSGEKKNNPLLVRAWLVELTRHDRIGQRNQTSCYSEFQTGFIELAIPAPTKYDIRIIFYYFFFSFFLLWPILIEMS